MRALMCGGKKPLHGPFFIMCFFAHSSMLGPSSRCVDENWGGSLKFKVVSNA
ncbi:hypothetical protein PAMP_004646 [Pampus punctatissimus]